jgi:hypothetical protein
MYQFMTRLVPPVLQAGAGSDQERRRQVRSLRKP